MEALDSIPIPHSGLEEVLIRRPVECECSVPVLAMPCSPRRFSGVIGGDSRRHKHCDIVARPTIHLSVLKY